MAHDLIWVENRRTPKVVSKGAKYEPKPSEGRITKRRAANADEERTIRNGGWVRVNDKGDKPGKPGYMKKKSKVRPQHNHASDVEEFAAERDETLRDLAGRLLGPVTEALSSDNIADALTDVALAAYESRGGDEPIRFIDDYSEAFERTTDTSDAERIATWLATAVVNAAAVDAEPGLDKVWVTMRDEDVRETHRLMEGTRVRAKESFTVAGFQLQYPGQPVGPPEVWINCRCVVKPEAQVLPTELVAAGDEEIDEVPEVEDEDAPEPDSDEDFAVDPTPFYGVLAVEGKPTGDKRKFAPDSLTWRDLPLPMAFQQKSGQGHEGSEVVGNFSTVWRAGNELRYTGVFADTDMADHVIGLIAEDHLRGVSVDVDSAKMTVEEGEQEATEADEMARALGMPGDNDLMLFTEGRVAGATIVGIPAFQEAFIAIGEPPEDWQADLGSDEISDVDDDAEMSLEDEFRNYDAEARRGMARKGQALPDGSFPIADEADLKNAIQAIGRASDPDKAKAHIKKRARALGKSDLIPEDWQNLTADGEEFKRGPGWVTHPRATSRIHTYWTKGKGAAKIRWGTPGDFTRCRRQLLKYVGPVWINRTCAQWHHDALGYWPGELGKPGNPPDTKENRQRAARHAKKRLSNVEDCDECENSVRLVASAEPEVLPATWFTNPLFTEQTPLTVEPGGRIYGHLALWDTCHIGFKDACVTPPRSETDYAYFMLGSVLTDAGNVRVGQITMNTGHADLEAAGVDAASHYDHTGTVAADVTVGEDEYGIWFAGAIRGRLSDDDLHALQAAKLSGDWRGIGGSLELVAALAVNVPGFPVVRPSLAASGGKQVSLIGARTAERKPAESLDINALAASVEQRVRERERGRELAERSRRERAERLRGRL